MTTVSIRLTSLIEWTVAVRPGLELERARQLARDDGALGAGVDDEAKGPWPPMLTGTVIRVGRVGR